MRAPCFSAAILDTDQEISFIDQPLSALVTMIMAQRGRWRGLIHRHVACLAGSNAFGSVLAATVASGTRAPAQLVHSTSGHGSCTRRWTCASDRLADQPFLWFNNVFSSLAAQIRVHGETAGVHIALLTSCIANCRAVSVQAVAVLSNRTGFCMSNFSSIVRAR